MSHCHANTCVKKLARVAITGLGSVSPLGRTAGCFWQKLSTPSVAFGRYQGEPNVGHTGIADFSGHIDDFGDLPAGLRKRVRKSLKLMSRETQLGVLAGQQALISSGILDRYDPDQIGVCFGADNAPVMPQDFARAISACAGEDGEFQMDRWGDQGIPEMAPLWLLKCLPNMPACHLAILNDLRGPNNTITTRDVAFGMAVAEACRTIRSGDADAVLVGAAGSTLTPLGRMHAQMEHEATHDRISPGPPVQSDDLSSAPAEGAGAFVLENLQSARRRGARIYGEILSSASASCVGHDGATACGSSLANAMRESLRRADLSPSSVGHIHAASDQSETMRMAQSQAIAEVFGAAASQIPVVTSTHLMGHAGAGTNALEVVASLIAMNHGTLIGGAPANDANPSCMPRLSSACQEHPGESFLSLSLFHRGLSHCIAVGAFHE